MISTMQRIVAENEELRRNGKIDLVVYWTCLSAVVGFSAYKAMQWFLIAKGWI